MTDSFKKQLFINLGIALGVIALMSVLTQLAVRSLALLSDRIQEQKNELALRTKATDQLASLKSDFEKTKPLFGILEGILPPKDQLINLGKELTGIAKQYKIDLGFTFGGETAPAGEVPGFIRFSISGESSYLNFVKFLKDVERNRLFIKINSVDLTKVAGTENFTVLANGQVFYR